MNTTRRKKMVFAAVAAAAMITACLMSGCGSGDSDMPVVLVDAVEKYPQKVYVIGELKDPANGATQKASENGGIADEMKQVFVTRVSYDGASSDAPVFIAADRIHSLTDTMKKGLRDTYGNSFPIVLVRGGAEEINELLGILGLDRNYTLPDGMTYVELFAVDHEDNHVFTWSMNPPRDVTITGTDDSTRVASDSTDSQYRRVGVFRDWMVKDGARLTPETRACRQEALKAIAGGASNAATELTSIADGFVKTETCTVGKNIYQLSYWTYSCHAFNSPDGVEYDWFYVRQEAEFNSSGDYHFYEWYLGNARAAIDYYIGSYTMNNRMPDWASKDSGVALIQASPQNEISTSKTKSSIEYDISGSLGFTGKSLTGKVDGGIKIKNETEFDTKDCQIENRSMDSDYWHNAKWNYKFNEVAQIAYMYYADLAKPALLARGMFQPRNHWIWKISPKVRDSGKGQSFTSDFDIEEIRSYGGLYTPVPWAPTPASHVHAFDPTFQVKVPLNYPPLLVVDHNMDFGKDAGYKTTTITVARNWTASSNRTWCKVEPASGTKENTRVNITVDANKTGASRSATITFKTTDGKAADTMTVFQARY